MPAKKKVARKTAAKRSATAKKRARSTTGKLLLTLPPGMVAITGTASCDLQKVCTYLKKLSDWLEKDFLPDYKALRIAVCNVEKQAFSGNGNPNKPPRFCTGGGGNEPADPPKPPVW